MKLGLGCTKVDKRKCTIFVPDRLSNRDGSLLIGVLEHHYLSQFDAKPKSYSAQVVSCPHFSLRDIPYVVADTDRSATSLANSGWLLPVSNLIELVAINNQKILIKEGR